MWVLRGRNAAPPIGKFTILYGVDTVPCSLVTWQSKQAVLAVSARILLFERYRDIGHSERFSLLKKSGGCQNGHSCLLRMVIPVCSEWPF